MVQTLQQSSYEQIIGLTGTFSLGKATNIGVRKLNSNQQYSLRGRFDENQFYGYSKQQTKVIAHEKTLT